MKLPNFEFKQKLGQVLDKREKATQLRESFGTRVKIVVGLKKDLDDPNVSSLSPEEFAKWANERNLQLRHQFPEAQQALKDMEQRDQKIREIELKFISLRNKEKFFFQKIFATYKKAHPEISEDTYEEISVETLYECFSDSENKEFERIQSQEIALVEASDILENQNLSTLSNSENLFLHASLHFLDNISKKRNEVENLKAAYQMGPDEFAKAVSDDALSVYLRENFANLKIEFTPYDIVVFIKPEDKNKLRPRSENVRGWQLSGTPFCFVVESDDKEAMDYTRTHEIGHNRIGCVEVSGIHNNTYHDVAEYGLAQKLVLLQELQRYHAPRQFIENQEKSLKEFIQSRLHYLNGEISADIENIVGGYIHAFYYHFISVALAIENSIGSRLGAKKDEAQTLAWREITVLEKKVAIHLKDVLFFSYIARKFNKQDEFSTILTMNPDSTRLLRRFFSEELGDVFEYESYMFAIAPEITLPEEIHQRVFDISIQRGLLAEIFGKSGSQIRKMSPPQKPLPRVANSSERVNYSNFEHLLTDQYQYSDLLRPERAAHFLKVIKSRPLTEMDPRIVEKLKTLLQDYINEGEIGSFVKNIVPEGVSAEAWNKLIDKANEFETILRELSKYLELDYSEQKISQEFNSELVNYALGASVVVDDPTPIEQVINTRHALIDKSIYFSDDNHFDMDPFSLWFMDYDTGDIKDDKAVLYKKFEDTPEQTRVYQYLMPIIEAQQTSK